ncbi:MAG: hypothetical protein ABWX84_10375 [Nocardioides sp.]
MSTGVRRHHLTIAILAVVTATLVLTVASWLNPLKRGIDRPPADTVTGNHAFSTLQPDASGPVGYDPCRPIRITVNPDGAPPDWRDLVDTAIAHVAGPSGLRFEVVGVTGDLPGRILDGDAPVLVSWARLAGTGEPDGDVAGRAYSLTILDRGHSYYATGEVTLDLDRFRELAPRPDADRVLQPILDHQLGHLVGLAHVDDEGELMNRLDVGRTTWGPGDLAGLAALGRLPCA